MRMAATGCGSKQRQANASAQAVRIFIVQPPGSIRGIPRPGRAASPAYSTAARTIPLGAAARLACLPGQPHVGPALREQTDRDHADDLVDCAFEGDRIADVQVVHVEYPV